MNTRPYQQCNRCVMDTSDPEIEFDGQGNCNHCTYFYSKLAGRVYQGTVSDEKVIEIVNKIKTSGKGNEYDCLLGISGGIDSCYAAYILKKHGLRTLLVHMDNGWNAEEAVQNIKHIANKLGFDYQSYVLDWEEFRDLQLSFLKASVVEAETPTDIAIPGALHELAAKYNIKYIISGGNFATEGILPHMWHYNAKDTTFLNAIQSKFGSRKIKKIPMFGYLKEAYYKFIKGIRYVYILNYVNYNKPDAMKLLEQELNWKYYGGKHYESIFTGFIHSYYLPKKFNLDYRKATLSTQICDGKITREEAIEELKTLPYDMDKVKTHIDYISKKLKISVDEFKAIIDAPPKTYRDYPNNEKMLNFFYNIYKKFFQKAHI